MTTAPGQGLLDTVTGGVNPPTGPVGAQGLAPPQPVDASTFTNKAWAVLVLGLAGDPITQNNIDNFVSWMTAENGADTWTGTAGVNNPLNNGLGSGGGSGLGSYPDLVTAAVYAAKGIEGGIFSTNCGGTAPGGIQAALKANASFTAFRDATIKSGWAGGCYSGSGWASATGPFNVPAVTVAQAAQNPTTNNPTLGDVAGASAGSPGLLGDITNALTGPFKAVIGGDLAIAGDAGKAAGSALSWADELGKLLGDLTSTDWWKRVGLFAGGAVLVIGGIILFVSTTKTGQKVESDAAVAAVAA